MEDLKKIIEFILLFRSENQLSTKQIVEEMVVEQFGLTKRGAPYLGDGFSIRFSSSKNSSFSNTVAALSVLKPLDYMPFVVCIIRPYLTEFLIANSTFIKKISHSSHIINISKIRGSFNGSDILREFNGIQNSKENIEELFSIHSEYSWEDNLIRLVKNTNNIQGTGCRFQPNDDGIENIISSVALAESVLLSNEYRKLKDELESLALSKRGAILEHAKVVNGKLRGDLIEKEITGKDADHEFADMKRILSNGTNVLVEVKTTLLNGCSSNPKAFNIDKMLKALSNGNILPVYLFVGIDTVNKKINAQVVCFLDEYIINATRIQFHWAGRNSRGVTQLTGSIDTVFSPDYNEKIDSKKATQFLEDLLNIEL